jgi:hypothetical protein
MLIDFWESSGYVGQVLRRNAMEALTMASGK